MKIICLGDSTMQYNDETTFPQVGWPQALQKKLNPDVRLLNFAKNGRSTRTFIEYGHFADALKEMDSESIVLIEFGHNDEHVKDVERFTRPDYEYRDNLIYMIDECHKKGAYVLLLTPIYRRWFLEDGSLDETCHEGYREAMLKVAEDKNVDVIDMTVLTKELLRKLGKDGCRCMFMNFDAGIYPNYPEGMDDNTHLRMKGAELISEIFIEQVRNNRKFEGLLNV